MNEKKQTDQNNVYKRFCYFDTKYQWETNQ